MHDATADTIYTAGWREGATAATLLEVRPECLRQMAAPVGTPEPRGPERLAPPPGENPADPAIGKWAAVVLEQDRDAAIDALAPLIDQRRALNYLWKDGIVTVEPPVSGTPESWLRRLERAVGDDGPHYLLLVGGPDRFPFELQYELDLRMISGRLDASDTPGGPFSWDACRRYAEKVVAYEQGKIGLASKPLFYSLTSDAHTRVSHDHLVLKLSQTVPGGVTELYGDDATVANLLAALSAESAPKLVFTASHGVEFPAEPSRWGALTDAAYRGRPGDALVSAQLVSNSERFGRGSIVFGFACFSAGVPECSSLAFLVGESDVVTGMGAMVAPLPRQLLGSPNGPVGFVGHVDRVSAVSFQSSFGMAGIAPFRDFASWLRQKSATVGRALETMRENARSVGARVAESLALAAQDTGNSATVKEAGRKWVGFYDYRGFILLGDPALTPP
ncbi:MAG: hypothetical protein AB1714_31955 [Acidobacteriota bacterium]